MAEPVMVMEITGSIRKEIRILMQDESACWKYTTNVDKNKQTKNRIGIFLNQNILADKSQMFALNIAGGCAIFKRPDEL